MVSHSNTGYKNGCRCQICRNAHAMMAAKYRGKTSDRIETQRRSAYSLDPEKVLERKRKWEKANPEKVREINHNNYYNNKQWKDEL